MRLVFKEKAEVKENSYATDYACHFSSVDLELVTDIS